MGMLGDFVRGVGKLGGDIADAFTQGARARRSPPDMLAAPTIPGRAGFVGTDLEPVAYIPASGPGEPATVVAIPATDFEDSSPAPGGYGGDFTIDPNLIKGIRPTPPADVLGDYLDKYPASTLEKYIGPLKGALVITAAVVAYLILRD